MHVGSLDQSRRLLGVESWLPPWTEMMNHCMKLSEIVGPVFEVLVAGIASRTGGYMADPGFEKPAFAIRV